MTEDQERRLAAFPYPLPAVHPHPDAPTDQLWYTYRCHGCRGIITKLEILAAWDKGKAALCECGGRQVSPTNPTARDEALEFDKLLDLARAISEGRVAPAPPNDNPDDVNTVIRALEQADGYSGDEQCECSGCTGADYREDDSCSDV